MANNVTRSTVNEQQYAAPAFQKSGFPLSYRKYSSYLLGRLHVSGYQNCMPGDKISGQNKGNFTMKRIVTPMVSDIEVGQYNFWLPFRAIDRTFERAFAPSKNNNMSASWTAPTVTTRGLLKDLFLSYWEASSAPGSLDYLALLINDAANSSSLTLQGWLTAFNTDAGTSYTIADLYDSANADIPFIGLPLKSLRTGVLHTMAEKMYLGDALLDIANNIEVKLGTADNPLSGSMLLRDFVYLYLDCLITPWLGRYSYYGEFKYKYFRPFDLFRIRDKVGTDDIATFNAFLALFDATPLSEYALRAMYVIWYEHFRNVDLEPVSSDLPYWRDFGSTSIFDLSAGGNLCYLIYRIRPWYEDMFTTAQIDDLSRHVFAPIIESSTDNNAYHTEDFNNHDTNQDGDPHWSGQKPATYNITWRDQLSGTDRQISCPVPANINDVLSANDLSSYDVFGLDLNTLRQSQMLERYLKRNYLFGDEYQDRMLAHYNSRVSDMRINRPELLSSSLNSSEMDQEVSNVSTAQSNVGDRTATGTLSSGGDQFTTYCEEFGILINLITFMPLASYDGIHPQLLCQKVVDFPLPEFATNNEEFGRKMEIADSALDSQLVGDDEDNRFMFGRYPAYHAWRQRVDEVGGDFLDELQDCTFRRFWGMFSTDTTPKLNYYFIHCRPNLGMFANTNLYDAQIYGDVVHECYVERVLPTPVETI